MITNGRTRSIKAMVVDDHAVTRAGIKLLLEQVDGIEVVAEAREGQDAIRLQRELEPDLVLMDLNMPGMSGIEATRSIKAADPGCHVLVISVHEDESTILGALRAGAAGYLPKSSTVAELRDAVSTVCEGGGVFISPAVTGRVMRTAVRMANGDENLTGHGPLTVREHEILRLLSEGLTARSIGSRLGISERTVNTHIGNLYRRLGVNNRVDAVVAGMRRGLLDAPHAFSA